MNVKYVQAGILICLIVICGLLFGIYQRQQTPDLASVSAPGEEIALAAPASVPPPTTAAVETPAPAEAKPSPVPNKPVKRPVSKTPKPAPVVDSDTQADNEQPPPPAPIIEPVVPNIPPLVQAEKAPVPPLSRTVTVPAGTEIAVRLINTLSTNRNLSGDSFQASLDEPLQIDGWLVAPKDSKVEGRIIESRQAGRVKGTALLSFDLVRLTTVDGKTIDIATSPFDQEGDQSKGDDMKKVGLGAGLGAVIGAIAGGGKGAAIGAGAGAGAGAGTVLATRGKTVVVPTETRLSFRLTQPFDVTTNKQASASRSRL